MENSQLYPEGWRFREFVGIFKTSSRTAKKVKMNDNSIVDQVMAEASQGSDQESVQQLQGLQQQLIKFMQQQGVSHTGSLSTQATQPVQG